MDGWMKENGGRMGGKTGEGRETGREGKVDLWMKENGGKDGWLDG